MMGNKIDVRKFCVIGGGSLLVNIRETSHKESLKLELNLLVTLNNVAT